MNLAHDKFRKHKRQKEKNNPKDYKRWKEKKKYSSLSFLMHLLLKVEKTQKANSAKAILPGYNTGQLDWYFNTSKRKLLWMFQATSQFYLFFKFLAFY